MNVLLFGQCLAIPLNNYVLPEKISDPEKKNKKNCVTRDLTGSRYFGCILEETLGKTKEGVIREI